MAKRFYYIVNLLLKVDLIPLPFLLAGEGGGIFKRGLYHS
jgi:hypothetical protein